VTESGPVFIQRKQQVTISLFCDDPYAYDTALQTVGFTTATAIPMGTAPTGGVITITGAAAFTADHVQEQRGRHAGHDGVRAASRRPSRSTSTRSSSPTAPATRSGS
jgi:hypothetical protein